MQQAVRSLRGNAQVSRSDLVYPVESTRETIRAGALELFAKHGFHAVSMRKLAARVGMQPGSIYVHFATKHDVLAELVEEFEECLTLSIKQALSSVSERYELQEYVQTSLSFNVNNPDGATLASHDSRFLSEGFSEGVESTRAQRRGLLATILQKRLKTRCKDLMLLAAGIESVILIAAQGYSERNDETFDELLSRTVCLVHKMSGLPV